VSPEPAGSPIVLVIARNEADRVAETVSSLTAAFGEPRVIVVDGGSTDDTAAQAVRAGAELLRAGTHRGKGGSSTAAARRALEEPGAAERMFVLCDGDLGRSAVVLPALTSHVEGGDCDLAVAAFATRRGGGFGIAVGFARWAIRSATGLRFEAPISGQRAMRGSTLRQLVPFASGFGMETAMTIDAVRAGLTVAELPLELEHRATGRNLRGFLHRGRQLASFLRVYLARIRR
jgi:glycosyltransferase involved in cell wall biosynthesis